MCCFFKADERFSFIVDWYDAHACFNRRYQLLFYPSDNSIELVRAVRFKDAQKYLAMHLICFKVWGEIKTALSEAVQARFKPGQFVHWQHDHHIVKNHENCGLWQCLHRKIFIRKPTKVKFDKFYKFKRMLKHFSCCDRAIAVLTSAHLKKLGQTIDLIYKSGLKIANMRQVQITPQEAYQLLETQRDKPNFT